MKKHFVTFLSPGTFVHEESTLPISSWDTEKASEMAHRITERHNAKPFAFYFTTRERKVFELDSKVVKASGNFFLGGTLLTAQDIEKRKDKDYSILLFNMRCNKWPTVIENKNSWTIIQPFTDKDTLLDWTPRKQKAA